MIADQDRDIFVILRKPAWMTRVREHLVRYPSDEDNQQELIQAVKLLRSELSIGLFEAVNVTKMVRWILNPEAEGPDQPRIIRLDPELRKIAIEIAA